MNRRVLAALVCVLLGVVIGFVLAHGIGAYGSDDPIGTVTIGGDGETLTTRSYDDGSLLVRETSTTVTLTLHTVFTLVVYPEGYSGQTIAAHLKTPVGTRRIVDTSVSAPTPPRFARPSYLPDGFVHIGDQVAFPAVGRALIEYRQSYASMDGQLMTITQSPTIPDVPVPDPTADSYSWTASGCSFTITITAYGLGVLPRAELMAIAASMR